MINFNFTSQICTTKEQSERLLALGLKQETADCILVQNPFKEDNYIMFPIVDVDETLENEMQDDPIPAWSLHRLLYLIPNEYFTDVDFQDIMQRCIFATSTLYDDLIDLIEALIKEEYFYKEHLEELCGKHW